MNPEELRKVWADAHRLLAEFGWKQDKVDRYIHEKTGLENLPALVAAAFPPQDEQQAPTGTAPGLVGTAVSHAAHGATLGFLDELMGALGTANEAGGALPAAPAGAPTD